MSKIKFIGMLFAINKNYVWESFNIEIERVNIILFRANNLSRYNVTFFENNSFDEMISFKVEIIFS